MTALGSYALWGANSKLMVWQAICWPSGLPILGAIIWGTLPSPTTPAARAKRPCPVPWLAALFPGTLIFGLATFCLFDLGHTAFAAGFGLIVLVHNLISLRPHRLAFKE
ncbi:MAG: YrdB family protein [Ardenticatenales bacterium]|nr:YrdB family protein [Ardenticatenales bacterium]